MRRFRPGVLFFLAIVAHSKTSSAVQKNLEGVKIIAEKNRLFRILVACDVGPAEARALLGSLSGRAVRFAKADRIRPEETLVYCLTDHAGEQERLQELLSKPGAATRSSWFLIGNGTAVEEAKAGSTILINQQVFFLNPDSGSLTEKYDVNGQAIDAPVAAIRDGRYFDAGTGFKGFLDRRSNFHGLQLRAMTGKQGLFITFSKDIDDLVNSPIGENLFDITNLGIAGVFHDILKILEADLNFTTTLLARESGTGFGYQVNGTWHGLMGNVLRGDADFIATSLTASLARATVFDYLHKIGDETFAIFINQRGLEEHAWLSFLLPLRSEVWFWLLVNALCVLIVIKFLQAVKHGSDFLRVPPLQHMLALTGEFWLVGTSYFGKTPELKLSDNNKPMRVMIFVVFLAGIFVFMVYRASLTSELSARRQSMPFETLIGLGESTYE